MIELIVDNNWDINDTINDFILNKSDNGTIFHLPQFLNYHSNDFFINKDKIQFKFYKKNTLIGYLSGVIENNEIHKKIISPYGASYGGFVLEKSLTFHEIELIVDATLDYLKENNFSQISLINTTSIHSKKNIFAYLDYILKSKNFSILKSDLLLVHQISKTNDLIGRFERKTITELKQPLKNPSISLEVINGVDEQSYEILIDSQKRLESKPTHSFDELLKIENLIPNTIRTFKVMYENEPVSGIITFSLNSEVLNTFYIFDKFEARDLKANHFAYYHVLNWATINNYKYLDFGPSTFGYIPNYPLIKFKEKFDTFPVLRAQYLLNI